MAAVVMTRVTTFVLFTLCAFVPQCHGYVYNTSGPSCAVSTPPPTAPLPDCPSSATSPAWGAPTLDEFIRNAHLYAPTVHFHPLEQYYLQTPSYWFSNSQMHRIDGSVLDQNASTTIDILVEIPESFSQASPRSYRTVANSTALSPSQIESIMAGARFDSANRSTARVPFTVTEFNDTNYVMYTFNYFFAWTGCSNEVAVLNQNGQRGVYNIELCPNQNHEGSWQHASVIVCKGDGKAKRMSVSQQDWVQVVDCSDGGDTTSSSSSSNSTTTSCKDVYSALSSHAIYPEPNDLYVYQFLSGNVSKADYFIGGLYVGDRARSDALRAWIPRKDLLDYMPTQNILNGSEALAPVVDVASRWEWARYAGNWGAPLPPATISFQCMNANQTQFIPCVSIPTANGTAASVVGALSNTTSIAIQQILKLARGIPTGLQIAGMGLDMAGLAFQGYDIVNVLSALSKALNAVNSSLLSVVTGPLMNSYSYQWMIMPIPAIQMKNMTTLPCPEDVPMGKPLISVEDKSYSASLSMLTDYIVGICVGGVLFSALMAILMAIPALMDESAKVQKFVMKRTKGLAAGMKKAAVAVKKRVPGTGTGGGGSVTGVFHGSGSVASLFGLQQHQQEQEQRSTGTDGGLGNGNVPTEEQETNNININNSSSKEEIMEAGGQPTLPASTSLNDRTRSTGLDSVVTTATSDNANVTSDTASLAGFELRQEEKGENIQFLIWFVVGSALFVSGMVLSIYGTVIVFNDSVVSWAMDRASQSSLGNVLEAVFVTALVLIAVLDIMVIFMLFFMKPQTFRFYKWKVHNYLGGWKWANRHAYELGVTAIAVISISVTISTLFFAMGFLVTIGTVAARMVCKRILDLKIPIVNQSIVDLCISLPGINDTLCGWEAMDICYNVTNLEVRLLILGAMFLLWCHLIWLMALIVSLEQHKGAVVVYTKTTVVDADGGVESDDRVTVYPLEDFDAGEEEEGEGEEKNADVKDKDK